MLLYFWILVVWCFGLCVVLLCVIGTATNDSYTFALYVDIPSYSHPSRTTRVSRMPSSAGLPPGGVRGGAVDRKSTRLNARNISDAVVCLKKKKKKPANKHKKQKETGRKGTKQNRTTQHRIQKEKTQETQR